MAAEIRTLFPVLKECICVSSDKFSKYCLVTIWSASSISESFIASQSYAERAYLTCPYSHTALVAIVQC